jgi:hypothetical protein
MRWSSEKIFENMADLESIVGELEVFMETDKPGGFE